jgi:transcription antitermination factor NusG
MNSQDPIVLRAQIAKKIMELSKIIEKAKEKAKTKKEKDAVEIMEDLFGGVKAQVKKSND